MNRNEEFKRIVDEAEEIEYQYSHGLITGDEGLSKLLAIISTASILASMYEREQKNGTK